MKLIKFLFLALLISQSFAQESITKKAEALVYSDNFHSLKIEKFFIHTNKSVYFAGEKIWFKAYIAEDDTNTPFIETTNFYINLYDDNFSLVSSHLFYAENGIAYGEIDLSKDLKSSSYYLQPDTQWNKNFNRETIFPIQIVDLEKPDGISVNNQIPLSSVNYPEVSTIKNGFQITRNENSNNSSLIFTINTSSDNITNKSLDKTLAFAVLHREGSLRSIGPVRMAKENTSYKISFAKDNLFNGLNTITLFDENNNVLTSSNFFYNASPNLDIKIENRSVTEDTLTVNLNTLGSNKSAKLSISVLPEESLMYKNNANIVSNFLLQPYLKKDDIGIAQRVIIGKHLDELTQLKANDSIFKYKFLSGKALTHANEAGLSLNGKVQTKKSGISDYKIMLSSNENNITEFITVGDNNMFSFNKLHLKHPTKYSLTLLNKKGKTDKASFFVYNTYVNYKANKILSLSNDFDILIKQTDSINKLNTSSSFTNATFPEYENAEALAEVQLEVYKAKKELELKQKLKNSGILGLATSKVVKPEDSGFNNNLFLTFLQTLPQTTVTYTGDGIPQLVNNRGPRSINDPISPPLSVIWDGAILQDLSVLAYVYANEIDYVVLNINGTGYGANFPYGVLHVVSKKGFENGKIAIKNKDIQENETTFGFYASKEKYELPELNFTSQKAIDNFSTIDWIPNVEVKPNSNNLVKINRRYHNSFKLIINGITEDGMPFYKEHIIHLKNN